MRNTTIAAVEISDLLSHGQENATCLKDLEAITGIEGRTIRAMIEKERRSGVPILSDTVNGYFLPANQEEVAQFMRLMKLRASEIMKTAAAVEAGSKSGVW